MNSELDALFVDGTEIDKNLVADILSPFIRIDKNTCEIRPLGKWRELKANVKILIYLLARKAMIAYGLGIDEEAASNAEIVKNIGVVSGTVRPILRQMYKENSLAQSAGRKYYIPKHAIERAKDIINEV